MAIDMAGRVKAVLQDLYKSYTQNQVGSSGASAAAQAQGQKPGGSMGEMILVWLMQRQ